MVSSSFWHYASSVSGQQQALNSGCEQNEWRWIIDNTAAHQPTGNDNKSWVMHHVLSCLGLETQHQDSSGKTTTKTLMIKTKTVKILSWDCLKMRHHLNTRIPNYVWHYKKWDYSILFWYSLMLSDKLYSVCGLLIANPVDRLWASHILWVDAELLSSS